MPAKRLEVIIAGNASGAKQAFDDTEKSSGSLADKMKSALGDAPALVGAAAVGAVAGIGVALKGAYDAAVESQKISRETERVIRTTGGAAGVTADQVGELAGSLSDLTGIDDEVVQGAENLLLTFCMEEAAQALAKGKGWVSHSELRAGDEILAYDPADDSVRWERVDSVHRFKVNGDLIRWKSKQIDVATTPHHRWWTVDSSSPGEYESRFRTTEEISGHQIYVKIGGGQAECFAGEPDYSDDLVELAGWVMTEGWYERWKDQSGRKRVGPRSCPCGNPARNAAGPARCDGCALRPIQSGRTSPRPKVTAETSAVTGVGICQSETANPLEVKRIRALVDRLRLQGHRISETTYTAKRNDSTMVEWHFAGDLGSTIRDMLPDKKLTVGLIERLTTDQGRLLLEVLIAGDGHVDRHGHGQFIQKDHGQLDIVAMLAAMLGRRSTVLDRGGKNDAVYFPETNRLKGNAVHAQAEHYEGVVWCPHLRTGIFLARCNGRTFWTGNTNVKNEVGEGNDVFNQATGLTLDMATALGTDASGAAIQLGKALNDPVKGITALSKAGVSFTEQQKDQIKEMVKAGDVLGAQKIVLAELSKEFGGAAEAAGTPLEKLQVKVGNVQEAIGAKLIPIVDTAATWIGDRLPAAFEKANAFVSDHVDAIQTLATVGLVGLAAAYAPVVAAQVAMVATNVAGFFTNLAATAIYAGQAFMTVAAQQGLLVASTQALAFAFPPVLLGLAAIALLIHGFAAAGEEGAKAADAFVQKLNVIPTNLSSLRAGIADASVRLEELGNRGSTAGDRLMGIVDVVVPFHDVTNSVEDARGEFERLGGNVEKWKGILDMSNGTIDVTVKKLEEQSAATGTMTLSGEALRAKLEEIAAEKQIDLTAPGAREKLIGLYDAATIASPAALQLQGAMDSMGAAASTADDKVKAFKASLDALFGISGNLFDAETKLGQAMQGLSVAHLQGADAINFNSNAAAANNAVVAENRGKISAAKDAAIAYTQAVYENALASGHEADALNIAAGALTTQREKLIGVMMQAGATRGAAESYINTLNLTPANITSILHLNDQGSPGRVSDYQNRLHGIPASVSTSVYVDVSSAEASLRRFGVELNDLERRVISANVNYGGRFADGGIVRHFAAGGEDHSAQITRVLRVFGEPETGGEAYIPLGVNKRGKSLEILAQVAQMFGFGLLPMADGGLAAAAQELAAQVSSGRWFEEDLSFRGMSANYERYQEQLSSMFWGQHPGGAAAGWDFGTGTWEKGAALSLAQQVIAENQASRPARQTFNFAPGEHASWSAARRGSGSGGKVEVHVHVGAALANEEAIGRAVLRGIVAAERQGVKVPWGS